METREQDPETGTAQELITGIDDAGRRLDRILRRALPDAPLSLIHRLLRKGRVRVDGIPAGAADRVRAFSRIRIAGRGGKPDSPEADTPEGIAGVEKNTGKPPAKKRPSPAELPAACRTNEFLRHKGATDLNILWEGAGLIILNKPAGLAVHGSGGDRGDNLNARLQAYLGDRLPPSLSFRPGPLHRLDQGASGVIAFSLSLEGARSFSALMRERRLRKQYMALADGVLTEEAVWEDALFRDRELGKTFPALPKRGRRPPESSAGLPDLTAPESSAGPSGMKEAQTALTRVFPLKVKAPYSLIALEIETGRTHQIRAQAALHGHPLAGDRKYGGSRLRGGLLLHAVSLEFPPDAEILPPELRGKKISAPLPERFAREIGVIFGEKTFEPPSRGYLQKL